MKVVSVQSDPSLTGGARRWTHEPLTRSASRADLSALLALRDTKEPSRFKRHFSFTESRSQIPNRQRHGDLGT